MLLTMKEKFVYLCAICLTITTLYVGFAQSIRSRIYHHLYQLGPYTIKPWLPLGIHVVVALSTILILTVLLAINILNHKPLFLNKLLSNCLYYFLFPIFVLVTPISIYYYNVNSPFNMIILSYFWLLAVIFYHLCLINWRKQLPITKFNYILALYVVLSSAAAARIIIYVVFEILKLTVSVEATFLYTAIYMNSLLLLLFSALGNLRGNKWIVYLTFSSTIVILILFFVLPKNF